MLLPGEPSTISPEREAERLRFSEDERAMLQAMERELGRPFDRAGRASGLGAGAVTRDGLSSAVIVPAQSGLSVAALARPKFLPMIRIAISAEAFEAIARTLLLGNVGYENKTNERGEKLIWLDRAVVDRLRSLRGAG
jgi:hypothetical protein